MKTLKNCLISFPICIKNIKVPIGDSKHNKRSMILKTHEKTVDFRENLPFIIFAYSLGMILVLMCYWGGYQDHKTIKTSLIC